MIFIVLAGFLLNGNKSKYCVLPDPCAGVPEVPGAGYARLIGLFFDFSKKKGPVKPEIWRSIHTTKSLNISKSEVYLAY